MKISNIGYYIIGSAIIWGGVIIGCSLALSGTGLYSKIQNVLYIGFILHLLIIWGPLSAKSRKTNESE